MKTTFFPSLLSVAECQYAKFGSETSSSRTGSVVSSRMPSPAQAPATRLSAGNAVRSWQALVTGCGDQLPPDGCVGAVR
ncbi:hypothetical protein OHA25_49045 [Nonomuraea sp. NBC_00507]|uniref:hypothetical protein n=1 Tax=Nonomuraea sp. NBC_00507 TaxID=2976002 RepID=UPI002E19A5D8